MNTNLRRVASRAPVAVRFAHAAQTLAFGEQAHETRAVLRLLETDRDFRAFHGTVLEQSNIWSQFLNARQDINAGNVFIQTLIARSDRRHRDLLLLLVILPCWSTFLIRVYAWMISLGPNAALARAINALLGVVGAGPVSLLFSAFAVLVCLVYVHLPFMVLPLYANLEKHDQALLDAAQDLGARSWQRFWRITFPLSLPGVYAGAALVFIPAFGIFAIPDILGGPEDSLIGNVIKQQFLETRDWPFGSVLSIVLTVVALALAGLAALIGRRGAGGPARA